MNALLVVAAEVGSGTLEGGWNYVWAAYGIFWGALALYGGSLYLRHKEAQALTESGEP